MLRITTHEANDSTVVLKLEGKLLGPWVTELERCAGGFLADRTGLKLDLSALVFADSDGAKALLELIRAGASLTACSGYLAALLRLEKS